jgi:hypothetical protein
MTELADNCRQSRRDDLVVKRCHEHSGHQKKKENEPAAVICHERRRGSLHIHGASYPSWVTPDLCAIGI